MYQQQQYHTASYRGNQQGHDQYLRADSNQPTSFSSNQGISQYRGAQRSFQPTGMVQSFYGQNSTSQFGQGASSQSANQYNNQQPFASTGAFHASNYRGDQQGHDQYLRADATQPSNMTSGFNSNYAGQAQAQGQGQSNQSFNNANAFHASSYRGNQQGHDQYLRADATQPTNSIAGGFQNQMNQNQLTNSVQNNQYQNQFQNQAVQSGYGQSYNGFRG